VHVLAIPGRVLEFVDEPNRLAKSTSRASSARQRRLLDDPGRRLGADPRRLRALEGRRGRGAATLGLLRRMGDAFEQELEDLKASAIQ